VGFLRRAAAVRVLTETCVISEAMIVMYMIKEDYDESSEWYFF
jgi:hypothetical protein